MSETYSFRWGIPILDEAGFIPVYLFMLRYYIRVGLSRDEFLCLLHLAAYRYESARGKSTPSQGRIADEMGYKDRNSVGLLVASMKAKNMLLVSGNPGETVEYNFEPFSKAVWRIFLEDLAAATPDQPAQGLGQPPAQGLGQPPAQGLGHEEEEEKKKKRRTKTSGGSPAATTAVNNAHPLWTPTWDCVVALSGLDPKNRQHAASLAKGVRTLVAAGRRPEEIQGMWAALQDVTGADPKLSPVFHNYVAVINDLVQASYGPTEVQALGVFWKRNNWPGGRPTLEGVRKHIWNVKGKSTAKGKGTNEELRRTFGNDETVNKETQEPD